MASITKTTTINAPPEKVFRAFEDPNQMPTIVPAVIRVSDVTGDTFRVTYGLMGMHFDLKFTNLTKEPPRKIVRQFDGGMTGKMTYTIEPEGKTTRVTFDVDYQISGGVLGKAMNKLLVERMNEKNAERMLENLKMLLETKETPVIAPT